MIFLYYLTIALFLFLCFILCVVILMQESKSTGLGASFGGEQADSVFGASTADVLKTFTAYLAAIFMIGCLVLSLWTESMARKAEQAQMAPTEFISE